MRRLRNAALPIVLGATALVAAACSTGGGGYGQPTATSTSAPAEVAPTTTIGLAGSPLGSLLVDEQGRTVYLFQQDRSGVSTCYDACAAAWPPVLTSGTPGAAVDVSRGDLGTTVRRDGARQVTYHGHPLYRFAGDARPGDTGGQGLEAFGAEWYVVGADGRPIDAS